MDYNNLFEMREQAEGLESLGENWDSYGGHPPTKEAIDSVNALIFRLEDGKVFSDKDGGAYIWFNGLEFRVDKDGGVEVKVTLEDFRSYEPKSEDDKFWVYGKFTL